MSAAKTSVLSRVIVVTSRCGGLLRRRRPGHSAQQPVRRRPTAPWRRGRAGPSSATGLNSVFGSFYRFSFGVVRTWFTNEHDSWSPAARAWNLRDVEDDAYCQNPQAAASQGGMNTGVVLYYTHTAVSDKQSFGCRAFGLAQRSVQMMSPSASLRATASQYAEGGHPSWNAPLLENGPFRTGPCVKFALSLHQVVRGFGPAGYKDGCGTGLPAPDGRRAFAGHGL